MRPLISFLATASSFEERRILPSAPSIGPVALPIVIPDVDLGIEAADDPQFIRDDRLATARRARTGGQGRDPVKRGPDQLHLAGRFVAERDQRRSQPVLAGTVVAPDESVGIGSRAGVVMVLWRVVASTSSDWLPGLPVPASFCSAR